MRHILLAAATAALCPGGHDLATDYGRARSLRTTSELEVDLETTLMETTLDGEPVEDRGPGSPSSSLARKCTRIDQVLAGSVGMPRHVKRVFEVLHDASTFSFGEDERSDERDHPLQGVTLELLRDEEGNVQITRIDGPPPDDEALLEGHELGLSLDAFLPEDAVEEGAHWDLDHAAIARALATALDARLFPEPPREERGEGERGERRGPRGRGGPARSLAFVHWEGKASLEAAEEHHGGLPCAKIALELEGHGELPEPSYRGPSRGFAFEPPSVPLAVAGTVDARLAGALFVSLAERRPVALELEGELTTENRFEREREGGVFASHSVQRGPMTLKIQVEEP